MFGFPAQDRFIKRCKAIAQRVEEEVLEVEGEFMTKKDMADAKYPECPDSLVLQGLSPT